MSGGHQPARYRIDVVARDVADAVRRAGGWIFDHAMQGWVVNVVLASKPGDTRPLQILGATVIGSTPRSVDHHAARLVDHRLSTAARRFKAHALVAAGLPPAVDPHESFQFNGCVSEGEVEAIETQVLTSVSLSWT